MSINLQNSRPKKTIPLFHRRGHFLKYFWSPILWISFKIKLEATQEKSLLTTFFNLSYIFLTCEKKFLSPSAILCPKPHHTYHAIPESLNLSWNVFYCLFNEIKDFLFQSAISECIFKITNTYTIPRIFTYPLRITVLHFSKSLFLTKKQTFSYSVWLFPLLNSLPLNEAFFKTNPFWIGRVHHHKIRDVIDFENSFRWILNRFYTDIWKRKISVCVLKI